MNTFLINYEKRDKWLSNGINFGTFLKEKEKQIKKGFSPRKAHKIVKQTLWRVIRKWG